MMNFAELPFLICRLLADNPVLEGLHTAGSVNAIFQRPLERQPCGVCQSDPFLEFLRCTRVVVPGASEDLPEGIEPDICVKADHLMFAAKSAVSNGRCGLNVIWRQPRSLDRPGIDCWLGYRPADNTLHMMATIPGSTAGLRDTRADALYLSMILEAAACAAQVPMGWLVIKWLCVQETPQNVQGVLAAESQQNIYTDHNVQAYNLVGPDYTKWITEVDLLRTGKVLGLTDPVIKNIHAPIIRAYRELSDGDEGRRRFIGAEEALKRCQADDWKAACLGWINMVKEMECEAGRG